MVATQHGRLWKYPHRTKGMHSIFEDMAFSVRDHYVGEKPPTSCSFTLCKKHAGKRNGNNSVHQLGMEKKDAISFPLRLVSHFILRERAEKSPLIAVLLLFCIHGLEYPSTEALPYDSKFSSISESMFLHVWMSVAGSNSSS